MAKPTKRKYSNKLKLYAKKTCDMYLERGFSLVYNVQEGKKRRSGDDPLVDLAEAATIVAALNGMVCLVSAEDQEHYREEFYNLNRSVLNTLADIF